jgi:N-acyl-D-amino-acid deacylase
LAITPQHDRNNTMATTPTRRHFLQSAAGGVLAAATMPTTGLGSAPRFDVVIRGGTIVDGTGSRGSRNDLGIRGDRVAAIGNLADADTKRSVNATGRIVCPGFIDMHSHSDSSLLEDGLAHSAVRQGATTHVIGNCGSSPAPVGSPVRLAGHTLSTYGDFLKALQKNGTSINVCGLVGHNSVRRAVMGTQNRQPTPVELRQMQDLVDEAMRSGAVGLSTGLVSPPGIYSKTDEIVALARVAARHGGQYSSHIRGEASTLVQAVGEAIQVGREAGLPVQISHHKAAGRENWGTTGKTLPMIEAANRNGQRVRVDVYPYHAGSAGMAQLVPPWAHEGGSGALLGRLKDPVQRRRIARDMVRGTDNWPNFFKIEWDDIQIAAVGNRANRKWVGKRVADVARARKCDGVQACIDLLIEGNGRVRMINFIIDEREMQRVLRHPLSMIGSDGRAVSADTARGMPHPRYYGCFPRVLGRYCRQLKLFPLETAIHKMTAMPARQLSLSDRGTLKVGQAADVVVFNFQTIIDKATFQAPHQYPEGIDAVFVNGLPVVLDGGHTETRPGRILRPQRS